MAETTPQAVADYILRFAPAHGDFVTNLKLQKLAYYAQAWYLALYNKPLFDEEIQAWTHGPVIPSLYARYKAYGWQPIPPSEEMAELPQAVTEHLDEVLKVYAGLSAYQLECLTHQEMPWRAARKNIPSDAPSAAIISKEDMRKFYKSVNESNQPT